MNQASMMVDRYKPHYLMIHSCSCDSIGHKFGGNSIEYSKQAWQINDQLAQHIPFLDRRRLSNINHLRPWIY